MDDGRVHWRLPYPGRCNTVGALASRGIFCPLPLSLDLPLEPFVDVGLPEDHLPVELDPGEPLLDELLQRRLGDPEILLTLDLCHVFP